MLKGHFISFMLWTIIDAWIFWLALVNKFWIFVGLFAVLLLRRILFAYRLDKFNRQNGLS